MNSRGSSATSIRRSGILKVVSRWSRILSCSAQCTDESSKSAYPTDLKADWAFTAVSDWSKHSSKYYVKFPTIYPRKIDRMGAMNSSPKVFYAERNLNSLHGST